MIKALIFDFAGVLSTEAYSLWTKEKIAQGIEDKDNFFNYISDAADRGKISTQEYSQELAKKVGITIDEVWVQISNKIKINNGLLDLISKLKKDYKIGLLSNYNHVWLNELIFKYELEKYFDSLVISSLHKVAKPEKKIYEISLNLLGIKPDEAIFFDDRQINIDGGKDAGIKSFLFTTNEKFIEDLKSIGISL